jgi:hypothetical protein
MSRSLESLAARRSTMAGVSSLERSSTTRSSSSSYVVASMERTTVSMESASLRAGMMTLTGTP